MQFDIKGIAEHLVSCTFSAAMLGRETYSHNGKTSAPIKVEPDTAETRTDAGRPPHHPR
jgi:hypothetical protein